MPTLAFSSVEGQMQAHRVTNTCSLCSSEDQMDTTVSINDGAHLTGLEAESCILSIEP